MRLLDQLDDLGLPRTQEISCLVLPTPVHVFERSVLQRKVGHHFFQRRRLTTQILHLARNCRTRRIARQAMSIVSRGTPSTRHSTLRRQYLAPAEL